ncbi:MAG: hypothetical protein QOI51_2301, partial [Nocardioidaceae bacterium]|nr:hypothetical protein [Nocardioidaceae bacterium]
MSSACLSFRRGIVAAFVAIIVAAVVLPAAPAFAALPTPSFSGVPIDPYAPYQGQSTCDPTPKPGVVDFQGILLAEYPGRSLGISRDCGIGGQSEHKEGRALDFAFNVNDPTQAAQANTVLNWLFATDAAGNRHALLRRFGIMYIIWNRHIFQADQASAGWQPYSGTNPHTDHIHFSFSWNGARKQTSWWTHRIRPAGAAMVYDDGDASMRILRWTSTGSAFTGPATYTSGPFHLSAVGGRIASGDVNGDGKDDIVMAAQNNDGTFSFHVFNGAATWAGRWYTSGPFNLGPVGDRLTVGDFNGDGKADPALVYDDGDASMRIMRWTSTGSAFAGPATYTSGPF